MNEARDLLKIAKSLTAARVGGAQWNKMLEQLLAGKQHEWQFDGSGIREMQERFKEQGAKPYRADSTFTEGPQINYKVNGMKVQVMEGNFMGRFVIVQSGRAISPYLGD